MPTPRYLIVADADFDPMSSKTANAIIRYQSGQVVGVLDREHAGRTVVDVLGFGGRIPVVGSMREGGARGPAPPRTGGAPGGGGGPPPRRGGGGAYPTSGAAGWPRRSMPAAIS